MLDGTLRELRFYAAKGPKGREVGDLLRPEKQVVEALDAVLVLCEDWRHDIYWLRREEEYQLSASLGDDSNEAFDSGIPRSGD